MLEMNIAFQIMRKLDSVFRTKLSAAQIDMSVNFHGLRENIPMKQIMIDKNQVNQTVTRIRVIVLILKIQIEKIKYLSLH